MGFFDPDMECMIEVYQCETIELMDEFEGHLIEAEKSKTMDAEAINSIFRVAHTIKSSSAMMGMEQMSQCTHRMEDLFALFRDKPELLQGKLEHLFDLLYSFEDYIRSEIEEISREDYEQTSAEDLIERISKEIDFFTNPQLEEKEIKKDDSLLESSLLEDVNEEAITTLKVLFKENCQMENARAFMLIKQISPFCQFLSYIPENLEDESAISVLKKQGLLIHLLADSLNEVISKLIASPYLKSVEEIKKKEEKPKEDGSEKEKNSAVSGIKETKFATIAWEQIIKLQKLTGELLTAENILENAMKKTAAFSTIESLLLNNKKILHQLEDLANEASLMSVSNVIPQYYRVVRDIAKNEGKKVDFQVVGEELEVDRNLMDTMANPLIHLLRNAIDHGIESVEERLAEKKPEEGKIVLSIKSFAGYLSFTVSDDGSGMDEKKLLEKAKRKGLLKKPENQYTTEEIFSFIFLPGFSTNEEATQYSGRGVGMDVVQNVVDSLNGIVQVESQKGKGSSFIIRVPVSMTSIECLCFKVGKSICFLPVKNIGRIYAYEELETKIKIVSRKSWLEAEEIFPLLNLYTLFDEKENKHKRIIILKDGSKSIAILTGRILGQQTVVEKNLPAIIGRSYRKNMGISGAAIMGDGSLGLILSSQHLIRIAQGADEDE